MKPIAQTNFAERVGRALGRLWQGLVRKERAANGWLVAQGVAPGIARAALLVAKLIATGLALYIAFWLALLLLFAFAVAWAARNADWDSDEATQTEWRYGAAGYGLYTFSGHRIDPHDPEDEQG